MPPVLKPREPCDTLIQTDPELNMFNATNSKYIFIDSSQKIHERVSSIIYTHQMLV